MMQKMATILALFAVSGAAAAAERATVRITRSDCVRLVEHRPSADVAFRPGVDVRGRKVAPADVAGAPDLKNLVPEVLEFDIALNPLKGGAARFGETRLHVGRVAFDMKTRRATLDGRPLSRADTRRLARRCGKALRAPE